MAAISAAAGGFVLLAISFLRRKDGAAPEAGESTPGLPTVPATAACGPEGIIAISRDEWGAVPPAVSPQGTGENGPYDASLNPTGWLVYDQPVEEVINLVIIHHSALPLSDGPREIQELHMQDFGFADIGYHFLIDEQGQLYEGRAVNVRGAHTYRQNYGSIGICLIGNFEEIEPSEPQLARLRSLLACLKSQYPKITRLAGHRDFNSETQCPGAGLAPLLPGMAAEFGWTYGA